MTQMIRKMAYQAHQQNLNKQLVLPWMHPNGANDTEHGISSPSAKFKQAACPTMHAPQRRK